MLQYKSKLKEHMFKSRVRTSVGGVRIESPKDILRLNVFPCFDRLPYSHDSRMILVLVCKWMDLSSEDTLEALRVFAENKGYYDSSKHLHDLRQIKAWKKYVFSCNTMKKRGLCPYKDIFCGGWFYLRLDLPDDFFYKVSMECYILNMLEGVHNWKYLDIKYHIHILILEISGKKTENFGIFPELIKKLGGMLMF